MSDNSTDFVSHDGEAAFDLPGVDGFNPMLGRLFDFTEQDLMINRQRQLSFRQQHILASHRTSSDLMWYVREFLAGRLLTKLYTIEIITAPVEKSENQIRLDNMLFRVTPQQLNALIDGEVYSVYVVLETHHILAIEEGKPSEKHPSSVHANNLFKAFDFSPVHLEKHKHGFVAADRRVVLIREAKARVTKPIIALWIITAVLLIRLMVDPSDTSIGLISGLLFSSYLAVMATLFRVIMPMTQEIGSGVRSVTGRIYKLSNGKISIRGKIFTLTPKQYESMADGERRTIFYEEQTEFVVSVNRQDKGKLKHE